PSRGHEMPRAQKAEQAPAKKATQSHGATAKDAAKDAPKKEPANKTAAKTTAPTEKKSKEVSKTPAKAAKTTKAAPKATGDEAHDKKFLDEQRELLLAEREDYVQKDEELKDEDDA